MESYNLPRAVRPITDFIDELSTWYLRRSRDRFKSEDGVDRNNALLTTRYILLETAKIIAPFMPFLAENLWQQITAVNFQDNNKSVHLEKWSSYRAISKQEQGILTNMEIVRRIVEIGLAKRDEAGIKIRQMLSGIKITLNQAELSTEYQKLIIDELNIQKLTWQKTTENKIEIELDTKITPELKQEGIKRELIRSINMLRKDLGLSLGDQATVYLVGADLEISEVVNKMKMDIMKDTLSNEVIIADSLPAVLIQKEFKMNELKLIVGLNK